MLQTLEIYHKKYSVLLAVIAIFILAPLFFLVHTEIGIVMIAWALAGVLISCGFFFFKGIAGFLYSCIYVLVVNMLMAITGILIKGFPDQVQLLTKICVFVNCGFFTFSILFWKLPARIRQWINYRMNPDKPILDPEEQVTEMTFQFHKPGINSEYVRNPNNHGTQYGIYVTCSRVHLKDQLPQSLSNASDGQKLARKIAKFVLLTLSAGGFALAAYYDFHDVFGFIPSDLVFYVMLFTFFYGIKVYSNGFVLGILKGISYSINFLAAFSLYLFIGYPKDMEPAMYFCLYLGVINLVLTIFVISIQKRRQSKRLMKYDRIFNRHVWMNRFLEYFYPIIQYDNCALLSIQVPADQLDFPLDSIDFTLNQISNYCSLHLLVFSGGIYLEDKHRLTVLIYYKSERSYQNLQRFLTKKILWPMHIRAIPDSDYHLFCSILVPDEMTSLLLNNRSLVDYLWDNGFDFDTEIPMVYTSYFEDKNHARSFQKYMKKYQIATLFTDNRNYATDNGLSTKYHFVVEVQYYFVPTIPLLDESLIKHHQITHLFEGEFDYMRLGLLE